MTNEPDPTVVAELTSILHDGRYKEIYRDLAQHFRLPLFARRDGLTSSEYCALAYTRLRVLAHRTGPASALVKDPRRLFALQELAAMVDGTLHSLIAIHYNLCLGTILDHLDNQPELSDYVDELETISSVGVFLATEVGYGNNVMALETEAVLDESTGDFLLNTPSPAARKYMPNTAFDTPKLGIVMARLKTRGQDCGVFPFVVRIRDAAGACPGVRIVALPDKPGLALDNAITEFTNVRVPRAAVLLGSHATLSPDGEFRSTVSRHERFLHAMSRVTAGKLGVTGAHLACSRAALAIALRYSAQRLTFSPSGSPVPILSYRNQQQALIGGLTRTVAMTFLLNHARSEYLAKPSSVDPGVDRLAAVTKSLASRIAEETVLACRERCGAQGMFSNNSIADYVAVGHSVITSEGDNEVIAIKAGQEIVLGAGYQPPEEPEIELTTGSLLDPTWWLSLFRARELRRRDQALELVQRGLARGGTPFEVWNAAVVQSIGVSRAHGARIALESFLAAVERIPDDDARSLLSRLAAAYALGELDRDAGDLLTKGLLTVERARQLPEVLGALYADLAGSAKTIVDAFALPDGPLSAPIASADYLVAYDEYVAERS